MQGLWALIKLALVALCLVAGAAIFGAVYVSKCGWHSIYNCTTPRSAP